MFEECSLYGALSSSSCSLLAWVDVQSMARHMLLTIPIPPTAIPATATRPISARLSRSTSDSAITAGTAIITTAATMAGVRTAAGPGMEAGTIAADGAMAVVAAGTEETQSHSCPTSSSTAARTGTLLW